MNNIHAAHDARAPPVFSDVMHPPSRECFLPHYYYYPPSHPPAPAQGLQALVDTWYAALTWYILHELYIITHTRFIHALSRERLFPQLPAVRHRRRKA